MRALLLFDIDGTLIRSGGAGVQAVAEAAREVLELASDEDPIAGVAFQGRTDPSIFDEILSRRGRAGDSASRARIIERYLDRLPAILSTRPRDPLPGVRALLAEITRRAEFLSGLATGNLEAGARIKLDHYGLWESFRFGGFGSDASDRGEVVRSAIRRGREISPSTGGTWVIGDTPLDIAAARSAGAKVVAVATGGIGAEELRACEPDALLEDLSDVGAFLTIVEAEGS